MKGLLEGFLKSQMALKGSGEIIDLLKKQFGWGMQIDAAKTELLNARNGREDEKDKMFIGKL